MNDAKKEIEFANASDSEEILDLYKKVVETVNRTSVRLGWNTDVYPDKTFVNQAIVNNQMIVMRESGRIVAAAVVNHSANSEYDEIEWSIKEPRDKIATIHALAVIPDRQGSKISYDFLQGIESICKSTGDIAIHLDVIDSNIPAYKLYTKNGYREVDCIKMFYEVVGTRNFWMLEHVL